METRHKKEDQQAVQQMYMFYTHLLSCKDLDRRSTERTNYFFFFFSVVGSVLRFMF